MNDERIAASVTPKSPSWDAEATVSPDEQILVLERENVRLVAQKIELRKIADKLAEAIRNHGPWIDDQCRTILAAYDAYIDGLKDNQ